MNILPKNPMMLYDDEVALILTRREKEQFKKCKHIFSYKKTREDKKKYDREYYLKVTKPKIQASKSNSS